MTTKNPTPSAISRLLGTKYTRGVNKLRGGNAGFLAVRAYWAPDCVAVSHLSNTMADTRKREREMCGKYAELIESEGYKTEYDEKRGLLLVMAREGS